MRFTYNAKRSIIGAHSADTEYDFVIDGAAIDQDRKFDRDDTVALDGTQESALHRIDIFWSCTTDFIETAARLLLFHEFLDSVAGGEQFTFDGDAIDGDDVDPQTVVLVSKTTRRRRVGTSANYAYQLRMRVV